MEGGWFRARHRVGAFVAAAGQRVQRKWTATPTTNSRGCFRRRRWPRSAVSHGELSTGRLAGASCGRRGSATGCVSLLPSWSAGWMSRLRLGYRSRSDPVAVAWRAGRGASGPCSMDPTEAWRSLGDEPRTGRARRAASYGGCAGETMAVVSDRRLSAVSVTPKHSRPKLCGASGRAIWICSLAAGKRSPTSPRSGGSSTRRPTWRAARFAATPVSGIDTFCLALARCGSPRSRRRLLSATGPNWKLTKWGSRRSTVRSPCSRGSCGGRWSGGGSATTRSRACRSRTCGASGRSGHCRRSTSSGCVSRWPADGSTALAMRCCLACSPTQACAPRRRLLCAGVTCANGRCWLRRPAMVKAVSSRPRPGKPARFGCWHRSPATLPSGGSCATAPATTSCCSQLPQAVSGTTLPGRPGTGTPGCLRGRRPASTALARTTFGTALSRS